MTTNDKCRLIHKKMQDTQDTQDTQLLFDIDQYEDLCISIQDLRTQIKNKVDKLKEYQSSVHAHMAAFDMDTIEIGSYTFTRHNKMRCKWNKKSLLEFAESVDTGTFEESITQYERECSEEQTIYSRKKRKTC